MLELDKVTLVAIDCINPKAAWKALKYSSKAIRFANIMLFTATDFQCSGVTIIPIPEIRSLEDYSQFCIKSLASYIATDYLMIIHADGFIINPQHWTDEFLNYDYIGAPWPSDAPWCTKSRVGNGGFSLRSKRFMAIAANLEQSFRHEDILLTNICHDDFIAAGCRYAPVDLAMKFSLEAKIPECDYNLDNCFGFHGKGVAFYHQEDGQQFKERIALLDTFLDSGFGE